MRLDLRPVRPGVWVAVVLVLASRGLTQAADAGRSLLDEVSTAYRSLDHYADRGEFSLILGLDGKSKSSVQPAQITFARPNRLRVEAGAASLVCDGRTLTTVVAPARRYSAEPAPGVLGLHHVAEGPVGSLLFGGPGGPAFLAVLGLMLGEKPAQAVLDLGGDPVLESDAPLDGATCKVLRVDTPGGTSYRLYVDPSSKLLKGIDVIPATEALKQLLPLGDRVKLEGYRWRSGPIRVEATADDAFAVQPPKDFARIGEKAAPADGPEETPKFQVQSLVGQPAPEFTLTVLDGPGKTRTIGRADLRGKVVMIDFWATWCGPCLAELPEVQTLIEQYAKGGQEVVIVALSQDNDPRDPIEVRKLVESTLEKKRIALVKEPVGRVAIDPSNAIGSAFKVEGYPTVVLLDREGVVRAAHVGFTPEVGKTLGAEIDALLAGKPIPAAKD